MKVRLAKYLPVSAERLFAEVQKPRLLQHVALPLQSFKPIDPPTFGDRWRAGEYRVLLRLFGVLPIGRHRIVVSYPSSDVDGLEGFRIRDNGAGDIVKKWDHLITIKSESLSMCRYEDDVDVEAGLLTFAVWGFACIFYRLRQYRLEKLVNAAFAY